MSGVDKLAEGAGNALNALANDAELVKEIYDDAGKPIVQEMGKTLIEPIKGATRIGRLINALFSDIDCWILKREYSIKETTKMLENKLQNIPDDKIKSPENYIAIPAIQALSYSMDSEELRNMYANLLAKAMCTDTANDVHPAFVEIIKQLSPLDARVFNYIASNGTQDIAVKEVYINNKETHRNIEFTTILTSIDFDHVYIISSSIDNITRLGLLEKRNTKAFDIERYIDVDNNPKVKEYLEYVSQQKEDPNDKIVFEEKFIVVTSLGDDFYKVCCKDFD